MTQRFLDPRHPDSLRNEIDAMRAGSSDMSPKLASEVRALNWVPLDDCICEGPHAQAKRLKMPASSGKWTWLAASMRLSQNLEDCEGLVAETKRSLRSVWSNFATVVQPPSKCWRTPGMTVKTFQRRVYRLDHLQGFALGRHEPRDALALCDEAPADIEMEAAEEGDGGDGSGEEMGGPIAERERQEQARFSKLVF